MNISKLRIKKNSILSVILSSFLLFTSMGCSTDYPESTDVFKHSSTKTENTPDNLMVHFLDVGQADSILIQIPNGVNLMIDAGNNDDDEFIINYLRDLKIERLDIVIGTHPHEDHIGSLDKVIENFEIGQVIMPQATTTTKTFEDVLTAIDNKGLKITSAKAGDKLNLENNTILDTPIEGVILSPKSDDYSSLNDYSVVLRLDYGENSFLFTGDAEETAEKEMLAAGDNLKVDVLKVGHHGSRTSTTHEFIQEVMPEVAVITVGENNRYGHPDQKILNRLKYFGVEIYRTDQHGTIIAESDGLEINWSFVKDQ